MTKEEAINIISNYEVNGCGYCHQGGEEIEEAFRMAIEALKMQSEIIYCKDCKHYDSLDGYCEFIGDYDFGEIFFCANGQKA